MGKPEGVIAIANAIPDMGALSSLNLSMNRLGGTHENYRPDGSGYGAFTATPEGPKAIADAIRDMGSLIKLDISRNCIGAAQEGELQRICLASSIELAK